MKTQNVKKTTNKKPLVFFRVKAFLKILFSYFSIFVCQIEASLSFVLYISKTKYKYDEEKFQTIGLKIQLVR